MRQGFDRSESRAGDNGSAAGGGVPTAMWLRSTTRRLYTTTVSCFVCCTTTSYRQQRSTTPRSGAYPTLTCSSRSQELVPNLLAIPPRLWLLPCVSCLLPDEWRVCVACCHLVGRASLRRPRLRPSCHMQVHHADPYPMRDVQFHSLMQCFHDHGCLS